MGWSSGLAFQLVDDVLDYRGESGTLGKNTGDDLREGKMTLPVILALADADAEERDLIAAALGDQALTGAALARIIAILERHNCLERTIEIAVQHGAAARQALRPPWPPCRLRTACRCS